jgi:hypothetical protein
LIDVNICYPGKESFFPLWVGLHVLQKIDLNIWITLIEGKINEKPEFTKEIFSLDGKNHQRKPLAVNTFPIVNK